MPNIFDNYDPVGALGGKFAPAYIHGYAPSEQAVGDWMKKNFSVTPDIIEQSRGVPTLPTGAAAPLPANPFKSQGITDAEYYARNGVRQPTTFDYTQNKGPVDANALRAYAQGSPYDINARRNAIAAQIVAQGSGGNTGAAQVSSNPTAPNWQTARAMGWSWDQIINAGIDVPRDYASM
jgi:hypothetical protein